MKQDPKLAWVDFGDTVIRIAFDDVRPVLAGDRESLVYTGRPLVDYTTICEEIPFDDAVSAAERSELG